jgi:peptide/nickel transport system permease protein
LNITAPLLGDPANLAPHPLKGCTPVRRSKTAAWIASFWAKYARVARAFVLTLREAEFVVAARAIGGAHAHVLRLAVLPNMLGPLIVLATLGLGVAVVAASGLSFLGFGVPPPAQRGDGIGLRHPLSAHQPWMAGNG